MRPIVSPVCGFYNSFQNCALSLNGEMFLNCFDPYNLDKGSIISVEANILSLDYFGTNNSTHLELNDDGVKISCGISNFPDRFGVSCIT